MKACVSGYKRAWVRACVDEWVRVMRESGVGMIDQSALSSPRTRAPDRWLPMIVWVGQGLLADKVVFDKSLRPQF